MKRRSGLFLLGLTAAILLGISLRLHTREAAAQGDRVRPTDSDSAYHMRRARFAAASFPRTVLFDPLMNFPEGGMAIWPPLFDLALAVPARVTHGANAPAGAVERGAAWVPVALAAGAIALAGLLGRKLYSGGAGVAAALFLALCPAHILWSQYAHTDQHIAESLSGLAALLLFVRSRARPEAPGNAARETWAGLGLALAVLTWQGAVYWGAILALSLLCESLRTRRSILRAAVLTLALPAAVTAAASAAWLGWIRPPMTYVSFGFFQPLFLAALAGGTVASSLVVRALRRELGPGELPRSLAVVLATAAVALPFAAALSAGLLNGIGYVAGKTSEIPGAGGYVSYPRDWLKGIFETRPLLSDGPRLALRQLSAAFFLAPAAILVWAWRALRGRRPGVHAALAVWGVVTLFLALSQRLNVYYAAPLAALTLVEAARTAAAWIRRRSRPGRRLAAAPITAAVGLALALPMWGGLRDELSSTHVPGSDLFDTLARMRAEIPHAIDAYDPGLLGPPPFPAPLASASSVMAPWSMGHLILFEAELPVVANNFGYGFLDSIRFFLAESEEEALAIAGRHRVRWIVVTDLVLRMNDYASYIGRPAPLEPGAGGMSPTPAYFRTMQSRLYDFDGKGAELPGLSVPPLSRVRLLFASRSAIQRGGRWLARWKVFEVLDYSGAKGGP